MISVFSRHFVLAIASLLYPFAPSLAQAVDDSRKPEAKVPAVTYRSVFRETSLGIEQERVDWRKANEDVGKFTRGHVDILKQEEMDGKAKPSPAKPAPHKH
jgi:hypothetical protein